MQPNRNLPNNIKTIINKKEFCFNDLIEILKYLRSENGCPWDKAQTHESIEINLIEEAYELVDAIEKKNPSKMLEETGDVLLQAVFHARIGEENKEYDINDVIKEECIKLITRHSHIFGEEERAKEEKEALKIWEKNKYVEKNLQTAGERVSDLPKNFPSLLYAEKVYKRASRFNYKKDNKELLADLIKNIKDLENSNDKENLSEKILFDMVSYMVENQIESEITLKRATNKFISDFCKVDESIINDNKEIGNLDKNELKGYYNEIKKR